MDNQLIYVDNDGSLFNARQSLQSARSRYKTNTLLPASESSFDYSTVGPGAYRKRKFESWTVSVEQRAGIFNFDFSYHHNKSRARAYAPNADAYDATLRGDPNVWLSPPQFVWNVTHSTDSLVLNPNAGQLFMDTNWQYEENTSTNDVFRLMSSAGINLKKFGRHNIVGMLEYSESERTRMAQREIYVDDNNVAIFDQDNPFGTKNRVIRRHYVTEGDFTTYYDGDGSAAVPSFTIGDKTYHTTFVSRNEGNAHTTKENMSYMLALQSYWFRDHLVTTFGYRIDDIQFDREQQSRVGGENPLYLSGEKVLNEYHFNGTYRVRKYNLSTYNAGAVYHVTDRFSLFGNYSSNTGVPYTDNRSILPDGNLPPPAEGTTVDYGVMVDVLANNKVFLKLTRFDTRQIHDGLITPGGTNTEDNGQLGSTNLETIFSALRDAGLISQAEYDSHPHYNCGMLDVYTKGYEAELTANLRNWNFRVTYSYSERERRNIFNEVFAYYNANVPVWMGLARDHPDVINTIKEQLYYIEGGTAVRAGLDDLLTAQTGSFGSVPHKVSAWVRRNFKKGSLKGFTVGAGFRYNSRRLTPDPRRTGFRGDMNTIPDGIPDNLGMDLDSYYDANMIKGPSTWFADMFLTYRRKVFKGKSTMMIQVNIRNLFDRYKVVPGRWAKDGNENVPGTNNYNPNNPATGYLPLVVRRVYINQPRTFQLTTQFDF
jgi:hypothetical protein